MSSSFFRWIVAAMLAFATTLSYLDRQSFPAVQDEIKKEITFSDKQYGQLVFAFLISYAAMYLVGGWILDSIGTRAGYTLMIGWWSLANLAIGFVHTVTGLGVSRAMLGAGEGGGFPASGKAVAEWFPPKERSFAFGLFNTGAAIGGVIAAPLVAMITLRFGWRAVFFFTGGGGILFAAAWWMFYRTPGGVSSELPNHAGSPMPAAIPSLRWSELLYFRQTWGLIIAKALTDSAWFFLINWIQKYLADERGFDLKAIGTVSWIPFACAGAGSLIGGSLGTSLISGGMTLDRSRKTCLTIAALIMPATMLIHFVPQVWLAVALMGAGLFAHQFWSTNVQTLAADLFPVGNVGSVEGLIGCAGAATAACFQLVAGHLVENYGWSVPFLFTGVFHPISLVILLVMIRRVEPVTAWAS